MRSYREIIAEAREMAKPFQGLEPPEGAMWIGSFREGTERYTYYMDSDGNYYYKTDSDMAFKRKLAEKEKRRTSRL